jgi:hypothetical protein
MVEKKQKRNKKCKMGQKKNLGEGGTRTCVSGMKRSSALHNFMIVAPLRYQVLFKTYFQKNQNVIEGPASEHFGLGGDRECTNSSKRLSQIII